MNRTSPNPHPLVSVVVTTKNSENFIGECLQAIRKQNYPQNKIEVIVVDNFSTDKTAKIAWKYTKHVYQRGPERSAQRNFGLYIARGEYLFYLDADMTISSTVISKCVEKMAKDPEISGLYVVEIVTGESYWSRVRRFERGFYDATVIDCVRFVRASDFHAIHGFDTTMTGPEDWDFDKKIRERGKVALIKEPIYHNEVEFDLKKYLIKKEYYARSFEIYINKWGKNDPDIKKQFGIYYRFLGVFIENDKWKKILIAPNLFVGLIFLRLLVGISYFRQRIRNLNKFNEKLKIDKKSKNQNIGPLISVIIATKNEGKHIARVLHSLDKQSYVHFEVILVDSNSSDKTVQIARKFGARVYVLRPEMFPEGTKNFRGVQVNYGVKKSKGEIIFFPDADMTFDRAMLEEIAFSVKNYDALYVPEKIIGKGLFGKIRNFERSFYNETCVDAVRIVRREIFEKVGGYDEKNIYFGPDDWDLTKMIKQATTKISLIRNKIYHHEELMSLKEYLQKKEKYNLTFEDYIRKWGTNDVDIAKQFGFYYRYFGVFIEKGKWKKVIRSPLLFLAVLVVRALVGFRYINQKSTNKK